MTSFELYRGLIFEIREKIKPSPPDRGEIMEEDRYGLHCREMGGVKI